jgi:hypothetical protein
MIKLFFSYSHRDEDLRNELETHLSPLQRQGVIDTWHDRRIGAGKDFGSEISRNLENSQIILLISSDFIASNYCYEAEMEKRSTCTKAEKRAWYRQIAIHKQARRLTIQFLIIFGVHRMEARRGPPYTTSRQIRMLDFYPSK